MNNPASVVFSPTANNDDNITMIATHGSFPGAVQSSSRIEAMIAAYVTPSHMADTAEVYARKWWDYRRMSPGHSFMLFAQCYYKAFRIYGRKVLALKARTANITAMIGPGQMQFKAEEIWDRDKAHITGMWNAMLTCDALGMPYDVFCSLAMQTAIANAWTRLPQPRQLYSDKLAALTLNAWDEHRAGRCMLAKHPVFLVEHYAGTPLQDAYREYAIEEVRRQAKPVVHLSQIVYARPQIPEDMAAANFPAHTLNRARLLAI